jgi:hypothetical protein
MTKSIQKSYSTSNTHKIVKNIFKKIDKRTVNISYRLPEGSYIRVTVRKKSQFKKLESRLINERSGIQRIVGLQSDGNWSTHAWLIKKSAVEIKNKMPAGKTVDVKRLLLSFGNNLAYVSNDNYILTN